MIDLLSENIVYSHIAFSMFYFLYLNMCIDYGHVLLKGRVAINEAVKYWRDCIKNDLVILLTDRNFKRLLVAFCST